MSKVKPHTTITVEELPNGNLAVFENGEPVTGSREAAILEANVAWSEDGTELVTRDKAPATRFGHRLIKKHWGW